MHVNNIVKANHILANESDPAKHISSFVDLSKILDAGGKMSTAVREIV